MFAAMLQLINNGNIAVLQDKPAALPAGALTRPLLSLT
jgi:hypothetical protein